LIALLPGVLRIRPIRRRQESHCCGSPVVTRPDILPERLVIVARANVNSEANTGSGTDPPPAERGIHERRAEERDRTVAARDEPGVKVTLQRLVWLTSALGGADETTIEVLSLKDGSRKVVGRGGTAARYPGNGYIVYVSGGTLFTVAFDAVRRETRGAPVAILNDVAYSATQGFAQISFSESGFSLVVGARASEGAAPGDPSGTPTGVRLLEQTVHRKRRSLKMGSLGAQTVAPRVGLEPTTYR
jgi:hypothetical protein